MIFCKSEIYTATVIHSLKHVYEKANQKDSYQHVLEKAFRRFKSQKAIFPIVLWWTIPTKFCSQLLLLIQANVHRKQIESTCGNITQVLTSDLTFWKILSGFQTQGNEKALIESWFSRFSNMKIAFKIQF